MFDVRAMLFFVVVTRESYRNNLRRFRVTFVGRLAYG